MVKILHNRGFTLLEVVVSITIFTLLLLALNTIFVSLYRQQQSDLAMLNRIQQAGNLLERMGRELRGANRGENGNFLLARAEDDALTFFSDVDGDGQTEKVAYDLSGTDLLRTVTEPGTDANYSTPGTPALVLSEVKSDQPLFRYYGDGYTGSESPLTLPVNVLSVRLVGISLTLNSPQATASYPLQVETKIEMRNLK